MNELLCNGNSPEPESGRATRFWLLLELGLWEWVCISQFSVTVTRFNQRERVCCNSHFWRFQCMINLPHWFWACGMIAHHSREQNCSLHGWKAIKERGRNDQGPIIPFKGTPPMTWRPPIRPHLWKYPPPSNSATLRNNSLTHGSLGDT
jgi:hypothetical protein